MKGSGVGLGWAGVEIREKEEGMRRRVGGNERGKKDARISSLISGGRCIGTRGFRRVGF